MTIVRMRGNLAIAGAVFMVGGAIFTAVGILLVFLLFVGTTTTPGTIVSCEMVPIGHTQESGCRPTVSFKAPGGQQVAFRGLNPQQEYHVGETLTVRYHLNDPQNAQVNDWTALFPLVIGPGAFLIGACGVVYGRPQKRDQERSRKQTTRKGGLSTGRQTRPQARSLRKGNQRASL